TAKIRSFSAVAIKTKPVRRVRKRRLLRRTFPTRADTQQPYYPRVWFFDCLGRFLAAPRRAGSETVRFAAYAATTGHHVCDVCSQDLKAPKEREHALAGGGAARNPRRCMGTLNTYAPQGLTALA